MLGLPVRLGLPQEVIASEPLQSPHYATAIGLLRFAAEEDPEEQLAPGPLGGGGILDKLSRFFSFF